MNDEQPDWSLLPGDPFAFFGLNEAFEREDLRRSYGRLIKRFRPETHPQEFQRIRAAYEQLDTRLRYGVSEQNAQRQQLTPSVWQQVAESIEQFASASTTTDLPQGRAPTT